MKILLIMSPRHFGARGGDFRISCRAQSEIDTDHVESPNVQLFDKRESEFERQAAANDHADGASVLNPA